MDASTSEHVISQIQRLLDAETIYQNRKLEMSITGASYLAQTIKDKIEAAKARVVASTEKTDAALTKLISAADHADGIATTIENEANDLTAFVGQFSNSIGATEK